MVEQRTPAPREAHQLLVIVFEFVIRAFLICYSAFIEAAQNVGRTDSDVTRPLAVPTTGEPDCNSSQRWYVVYVGKEVGVFESS